jgi:NADPH:quinone reductase-like Zn-dependent oxidoreductase
MKAVQIDRFGGPEELKLNEAPIPEPGPGQVLIKSAYASINPADWKGRAGLLPHLAMMPFPMTMGMDCSGVVAAVGEGVTDFQPGERVVTLSGMGLGLPGTYAEYCIAPAPRVAPLPAHLSLAEGATLPIASASAASSILDVAKCKAGDKVLVNGGAGSVGTFAIQFLRYLGAQVAATCSTRNIEHVRGLGADLVIDYTRQDILAAVRDWAPAGLDSVIDAVGQHSLPFNMPEVIKSGGVLVSITNLLTGIEAFDLAAAEARNVQVLDNVMSAMTPDPTWFQVAAFRQLMAAVAAKSVKPPPYKIMPLEQAAAAQIEVADGHVRGKILLEIAGGE